MFSSFQEAVSYLESFIVPTQFSRIEKNDQTTDPLHRMRHLLKLLGNPQNSYPSIQVSGTSGKGSTAYLISRILDVSGKKVGFTLSPHLQTINERIQINNVPISNEEFIHLLSELQPTLEEMKSEWIGQPTYFEVLLAMAFLYFQKQKIDILVAEVGIEGQYDGTNVLHPLLAVLTNISLDHTKILGDSVEKIAEEATSIIKEPKMTIVTGVTKHSVKDIVSQKAENVSAVVIWCDSTQILNYQTTLNGSELRIRLSTGQILQGIKLSLVGSYQHLNAVLAIEAILSLKTKGFEVSEDHIRHALSTASFPGRFEILNLNPLTVLDGAHNPAKMEAFIQDLNHLFPDKEKIFCLAFKEGKDIKKMIQMVERVATAIVITQFSVSTDLKSLAAPVSEIKKEITRNLPVQEVETSQKALEVAQNYAKEKNGMLVVTGSLYLVGEIRSILGM